MQIFASPLRCQYLKPNWQTEL